MRGTIFTFRLHDANMKAGNRKAQIEHHMNYCTVVFIQKCWTLHRPRFTCHMPCIQTDLANASDRFDVSYCTGRCTASELNSRIQISYTDVRRNPEREFLVTLQEPLQEDYHMYFVCFNLKVSLKDFYRRLYNQKIECAVDTWHLTNRTLWK